MSQFTLLMGPERRRRWSEDEQERILAEAFSPGAVVTTVARRFDVSTSLIYKWRSARLTPEPDRFAPVVLMEEFAQAAARDDSGPAIIVELSGGARVSIGARAPANLVAATLRALR